MQVRHSLLTEQVVPGLALAPQIPQLQIPLLQTDFTISLKYFQVIHALSRAEHDSPSVALVNTCTSAADGGGEDVVELAERTLYSSHWSSFVEV